MRSRINFGAGPAKLPDEVLQQAAAAVLEYNQSGYSILELPHRSREFDDILEESKVLVRELCGLSPDYEVLWMQGGGRAQFAMIPLNLIADDDIAGYVDTGHWAAEAIKNASIQGKNVAVIASSKEANYNHLPGFGSEQTNGLRYLHITTNNTIYGTQYHVTPPANCTLIADMSSDIFGMERDYTRYGLFYAVAQKNIGTPGNTLVVMHKSLLERQLPQIAPSFSYHHHLKERNLLHTPNVSGIYITLLMLRWTKRKGLAAIARENEAKATALYRCIDKHPLFAAHVQEPADRSIMNVCFTAKTTDAENQLIRLCAENNIVGIEGHRTVGGFRVSLYNSVTMKDLQELIALIDFVK